MEGYLKKWVNLIYQWQNRYFIIHEDSLIYCQTKGGPKKGQVHLSICSVRQVQQDPLRIVINYGMSEMHLRASSTQEKQKWLDALLGTQQKINTKKQNPFLSQRKKNPFEFMEDCPIIDLKRIHTTLTKIWVMQAQLEEQISFNQVTQIGKMANDLKLMFTTCAQEMDDEYNKLIIIVQKLQQKIRETNDINPPDHDDFEEYQPTEQYLSFKDDEFQSICNELYDEREQQTTVKRTYSRQETSPLIKTIPIILEQFKHSQPIKYKNMITSDAFKVMTLGSEDTRQQLPVFKDPKDQVRLFSVIRDMVGKDLTKITFPVTFNEPLSMLQNLCETLEYSDLLDQANAQQNSWDRLAYTMTFAVSSLSSTINRLKKPFNPILGETFEYSTPKFRFIAEQVSHHPPISVGYAENQNFELIADNNVKTQFWGKSIEVIPQGWVNVKLKKYGDDISFQRCKSACKNLIIGTQYLDHYGEMIFKNESTGDTGLLKLTERGWNGGGAYQLNGWVKDRNGAQKCIIQGKWDSSIDLIQNGNSVRIWSRNDLPIRSDEQYYFTKIAINLNHLNKQLLKQLPPTDSRLRPDQRALENGNVELAAIDKTRLEQKQRNAKKEQGQKNAQWFSVENTKYIYNGTYWQMRETPDFHLKGLDIF